MHHRGPWAAEIPSGAGDPIWTSRVGIELCPCWFLHLLPSLLIPFSNWCVNWHTWVTKSDHQTTAKMQRVDLFHCLANNARQGRHTATQAPFGSVHADHGCDGAHCWPHSNNRIHTSVGERSISPQDFYFSK